MSNPVFCLVAGIWYYHYFFFILANSDKCVLLSHCGLNFFPLRENSHTIRLTLLNCTVPWCVVYSHMINHHQNLFPKHFHPSEKKPSTHYPSLPVLPSSQPRKMWPFMTGCFQGLSLLQRESVLHSRMAD